MNVVKYYSGRNIPIDKDSWVVYDSSYKMTVEQVFGMLARRLGIFWRYNRTSLKKNTKIIWVACNINNFIIENAENDEFEYVSVHDENNVVGAPVVFRQIDLHGETYINRGR